MRALLYLLEALALVRAGEAAAEGRGHIPGAAEAPLPRISATRPVVAAPAPAPPPAEEAPNAPLPAPVAAPVAAPGAAPVLAPLAAAVRSREAQWKRARRHARIA